MQNFAMSVTPDKYRACVWKYSVNNLRTVCGNTLLITYGLCVKILC